LDNDTIWLQQEQIASIFWVKRPAITKHISNIYITWELQKNTTSSIMEQVQIEWSREVKRKITCYNLDMIISIGYRVNSKKATHFRQRATSVLKQHIVQWYTINASRIEKNLQTFLLAVEETKYLAASNNSLSNEDILDLIEVFWRTWFWIESYDRNSLPITWNNQKNITIQANELYNDIEKLKNKLIEQQLASELFAQEKNKKGLEWIIGNIFQSAFWTDVYPSLEEKAAHLLYFIIKNHPFTDGNKRSGAFSFIRFLNKSKIPFKHTITPEALTTLTIMIAESNPKEKNRMIWLIILLISQEL
jgi:death-on-curing family protein